MLNTTRTQVVDSFESLPQDKYILPDGLIDQWLIDATGEYSLEISSIEYDSDLQEFSGILPQYSIKTIALIMYTYYLTRELSRVTKLNGIIGKDISLTGMDATKRVTKAELESELMRVQELLHKQKQHCFNN